MMGLSESIGKINSSKVSKMKELKRKSEGNVSFNDELQRAKNRENKKDRKLWDTCIEMESLFVNNMFKEMRKTVHKSDWTHGGHAEEIFEDMLYDEYSLQVSKNSNLGLAKMIYEQMSQKV